MEISFYSGRTCLLGKGINYSVCRAAAPLAYQDCLGAITTPRKGLKGLKQYFKDKNQKLKKL